MSEKTFLKYVPHGIDENRFFRVSSDGDVKNVKEMKKSLFGDQNVDFVVLYNNRNIRRKMVGNVVLAYREFFLGLSDEQREKTRLLLHTDPIDENGTDLPKLIRDIAPEISVVFSSQKISTQQLNYLYNLSDVVINLANAEGWGLGITEGIMAERMIVATVTGGLQDQMGFVDWDGVPLHEDIHYTKEWGTNHDGKYRYHGEWVEPVFPVAHSIIGSVPTPYIFEDHVDYKDAARCLRRIYDMSPDERVKRGKKGREFAIQSGYTASEMCERMIDGIDAVFEKWTPRKRFELVKV